ncbi:MAG TPA: YaiO family outer membrane beta-barrel protein [Flavisolibacter sp.]|nr:YaiO family outer membrane beta-barrel protein [Flavisolibacter sp.]
MKNQLSTAFLAVHRICNRFFFFLLLCSTIFLQSAHAQTDSLSDPDKAFAFAKNLAFTGQRENGRDLALRILQKHPHYLDVKTFVGRTYAWDGNYDMARKMFAEVEASNAKTLDNYIAWIDAERWANEAANALAVTEKGLRYFAEDPELLYRKAKLFTLTGKMAEAKYLAQKLLHKHPNHGDAYLLLQELRNQLLDNEVAAGFTYEEFSRHFSPARFAFVQASRATPLGAVIGRINYASRPGRQSFQPEVELYPKLSRTVYAYLNAGFSDGELFPKQRYGAEIFASLPHGLEASAGLRHLSFSAESKVTVYTGSVGYYTGNYWLSFRPYITPGTESTSIAATATVRRYFSNPEHYLAVRLGAGNSPELLNTQTTQGTTSKAFYGLKSQAVNIGYQHPVSTRWSINGNITIGRQETLFAIGEYASNMAASLIVKYRYR